MKLTALYESQHSDKLSHWCAQHIKSFKTADDAFLALRRYADEDKDLNAYLLTISKGEESKTQRFLTNILMQVIRKKNLEGELGSVKLHGQEYSNSESGSRSASM